MIKHAHVLIYYKLQN